MQAITSSAALLLSPHALLAPLLCALTGGAQALTGGAQALTGGTQALKGNGDTAGAQCAECEGGRGDIDGGCVQEGEEVGGGTGAHGKHHAMHYVSGMAREETSKTSVCCDLQCQHTRVICVNNEQSTLGLGQEAETKTSNTRSSSSSSDSMSSNGGSSSGGSGSGGSNRGSSVRGIEAVLSSLLQASEDTSQDKTGEVGRFVRAAAMTCLTEWVVRITDLHCTCCALNPSMPELHGSKQHRHKEAAGSQSSLSVTPVVSQPCSHASPRMDGAGAAVGVSAKVCWFAAWQCSVLTAAVAVLLRGCLERIDATREVAGTCLQRLMAHCCSARHVQRIADASSGAHAQGSTAERAHSPPSHMQHLMDMATATSADDAGRSDGCSSATSLLGCVPLLPMLQSRVPENKDFDWKVSVITTRLD